MKNYTFLIIGPINDLQGCKLMWNAFNLVVPRVSASEYSILAWIGMHEFPLQNITSKSQSGKLL